MEGCNFKIGDMVAYRKDVEEFSTGSRVKQFTAYEIVSITEQSAGIFITTTYRNGMPIADVIPENEVKSCALKYLANRMAIIVEA